MNNKIQKKPRMIIFDAGRTLIDYIPKGTSGGNGAMNYLSVLSAVELLMPYITHNPHGHDAVTINRVINETFARYAPCRKALYEVHEQTILRLIFDILEIRFSVSLAEIERILWENSADIEPVDGTGEMLQELNKMGIRTAVISNLDFSGYLLEERLKRIFPHNQFEFVIASSDYGVRKPQSLLFEVGLAKSGLQSKDIWYVGDKVPVDVAGSKAVGMVPVLYKNQRNTYGEIPDKLIVCENYRELVGLLQEIERRTQHASKTQ